MSEPEAPRPDAPRPHRLSVDVVLKRDAKPAPHPLAVAGWSRARTWVALFFVVFCLASWFAWVELHGLPIATYVSALPQLGALLGAATTLLAGGDPNATRNWYQTRAVSALLFLDRRAARVCAVLAVLSALLVYAGTAMRDIEVECPPGCQLLYGHLGAQLSCDQHRDRVWMPLGLEEVAASFECSLPGGHGEWPPLRRLVRDDEGEREVFSCYEDGSRVRAHPSPWPLAYLEYGWAESQPARTPAPCDHLPVGLYQYEPGENTCTWALGLDELTALFVAAERTSESDLAALDTAQRASVIATRDALDRLIGSACHDCPTAAEEEEEEAAELDGAIEDHDALDAGVPDAETPHDPGAPPSTPPPRSVRSHAHVAPLPPGFCPRPHQLPFAFFQPSGCHGDASSVALELTTRQVEIGVGISYRGGSDRRCVPAEDRRDGYVHFLLPDGELVFGVTLDAPRRVVLVEDVRSTTPPPALAASCTE